jgi:NadR type nicotinamide-nucleotide adenylyltransferase
MVPKVVVTGSECTGKTTLARLLGARFHAPVCAEYARDYVTRKGGPLEASDVEPIARGQLAGEDAAARRATRLVVLDTDLVSTVIYARHYYGECPEWIARTARARLAALYLLCEPDLPWVPDGWQRDRPGHRGDLHAMFSATLEAWGARVVTVSGWGDARSTGACVAVGRLLDASRAGGNDSVLGQGPAQK